MRYFWIIFLSQPLFLFAQIPEHRIEKDSVYSFVEQQAEFPGGIQALSDFLALNLIYPEQAIADSIEGRIYVEFIVEKDGSLSSVKILRGIGGGCDEEAIRVIQLMPEWNPGESNGETVRVKNTLPVNFSLAKPAISQTKIYIEVDTLPQFKGGDEMLSKYISEGISGFDPRESDTITDSRINVFFVVEIDGQISNVVVKDSTPFILKERAIEIVQQMPNWIPGKIENTTVRSLFAVPVDFNIFQVVEEQPEFPGGMNQLYEYLKRNVKYPKFAKEHGIQGRVFVNFIVEADGSITNAKVLRGPHPLLDKEALRVVNKMPKWKPGIHRGIPTRVSFNLPIKFTVTPGLYQ